MTDRSTTTNLETTQRQNCLLLQGDALATTACIRPETVDLIYLDPPFFTGRNHRAGSNRFQDSWRGDRNSYIGWLLPRIRAMRRLLKPTGSLFLHLDWHAVHYAKTELDRIFGPDQFINEIIWSYRTGGITGRWLARKHDAILFYAKSGSYKFNKLRERSDLSHKYGFSNADVQTDERGPYRLTIMRDVWDIPALRGNSAERVQFPTQKPLPLLERIIKLTTDPGDLVADFFCGSGTTLVAALGAGRRIIGGDQAAGAIALTQSRIENIDLIYPAKK